MIAALVTYHKPNTALSLYSSPPAADDLIIICTNSLIGAVLSPILERPSTAEAQRILELARSNCSQFKHIILVSYNQLCMNIIQVHRRLN